MKIFFATIIICFLFAGFWGCKKYPEDHQFPWHTAFHRITRIGQLTKYVVNGIDSTGYLPKYIHDTFNGDSLSCIYQYYFTEHETSGGYVLKGQGMGGHWLFSNKKKEITIAAIETYAPEYFIKNIFINEKEKTWTIRKLTENEMHLKTVYNGNTYDLLFEKNT